VTMTPSSAIIASQLCRRLGTQKKSTSASAVPPADGQNSRFIWFCELVAAVVFTVSIDVCAVVPLRVTDGGDRLHVTGSLAAVGLIAQLRFTGPANPFTPTTLMVAVFPVVAPGAMLKVVVLPLPAVKVGAAVTVRVTDVVAVSVPEVPAMVTVTGDVVTAAELLAVRVSTWVPAAVPAAKPAVTPLGSPDAASATLPLNPPAPVTAMVLVPLLP